MAFLVYLQTAPPAAVTGWLPVISWVLGALVTGATGMYAWGKWTQTINGFGERVKGVETRLDYSDARDAQMQQNIDRVLNQHSNILEKLGEVKKGAEQCSEDMDASTHRIETKLDAVRDTVSRIDKELSGKIAALEATGRRLKHENT